MFEKKKKKQPELNKPKAGSKEKYYVYVKDPKTGNIKKVTWGDTTGLKVKLDNKKARKGFAKKSLSVTSKMIKLKHPTEHVSYHAYAKQLGLSGGGSFLVIYNR